MYKRLKPGEFMAMTDEQKKTHLRMLRKRYREAHKDKIHENNIYYYQLYKKTKPHKCICKKCGKPFNAPRWYFKLCDDCLNKDWGGIRKQAILEKRNARISKHEQVVELAKKGLFQVDIARIVGYSQVNVSKIMCEAGMRQIKKHKRVIKK